MSFMTDFFGAGRELLTLGPELIRRRRNPVDWDEEKSLATYLEDTAAAFGDRPAITYEDRTVTWREYNELVNQAAYALREEGVEAGDCVSLLMENRLEFLVQLLAIVRLGATAALINTNLRGQQLIHCLNTTKAKRLVFGRELEEAVSAIKSESELAEGSDFLWVADSDETSSPNWAHNLTNSVAEAPSVNLEQLPVIRRRDPALYIFTSGTTGLPKAAIMAHGRLLGAAEVALVAGLKVVPSDRFYLCLPLYHGTGLMIGFAACLVGGASAFLRRRFSASRFLDEVREQGCNTFIYIGELCRYLMAQPEQPGDHDNPLVKISGNGLRPDIWHAFKKRFGIEQVLEFYGSTEGNVAFMNVFNRDCTVGLSGGPAKLVAYDIDADEVIKGEDGFCQEVAVGEAGLLVAPITKTTIFEGYTNREATEKKILHDVFQAGDQYFNTGDLLKVVDVGFAFGFKHYQFVDRVGDTFRWKGENCSTNEVAEILNTYDGVELSNVYGVEIPGTDGRAGMAAIKLAQGRSFDAAAFGRHVHENLATYARPVFVRLLSEVAVTGTFKLVKSELREEAYHPDKFSDEVYVLKPGSSAYERLDESFYRMLSTGEAGY
ncbi:MAG: long-chain-acyl-CoA synthetase [Pseudomonadota bacterium]